MTTQQISLVQESFEMLRPIAQIAGELFYKNLFDIAPQAKAMFKTPIPEQAGKLMYTLSYVVTHLHTPETIMDDVRKLAIRHNQYGARPEHYELVGSALLKTLEQGLAENWTAELQDAWAAAYTLVSTAMIHASAKEEAHKQAA
jgi:nitric oxide dioxygenase